MPDAVRALKAQDGGSIAVLGSGVLVRTLFEHDLVDELELFIHPLIIGSGKRLFPESPEMRPLELVDVTPTTTGVLLAATASADAATRPGCDCLGLVVRVLLVGRGRGERHEDARDKPAEQDDRIDRERLPHRRPRHGTRRSPRSAAAAAGSLRAARSPRPRPCRSPRPRSP